MIRSALLRKSILFFLNSDSNGILNSLIFKYYNEKIGLGPFAGMKYINKAHGSSLTPKIIGTYERELHPFIYEIADKQYDCIVDVGSAEGYYAVGLAYLYHKKRTVAFRY